MFNFFLLIFLSFTLWSCQEKNVPQAVVVPQAESRPVIPPVAHIESLKSSVQQRPTQTTSWIEAFAMMPLHNKDEIKTPEGGSAFIKFVSGKTSLNVEEKSFVVIWDRDEDQKKIHMIALPEGELKGVIEAEANEEMEVRTPGGWIQAVSDPIKKQEVEFKVSSVKAQKVFKVSVTKGEALVTTATQTSKVKAGRSIKITYEFAPDISGFMENIPLKTILIKEKKFTIEKPRSKEMKVKEESITFSGVWEGEFSVWANGNILQNDGAGRFSHTFQLTPGLNVITLQVSDPDKKNVEYYIYKISRADTL